jgi:hypothetical protein
MLQKRTVINGALTIKLFLGQILPSPAANLNKCYRGKLKKFYEYLRKNQCMLRLNLNHNGIVMEFVEHF